MIMEVLWSVLLINPLWAGQKKGGATEVHLKTKDGWTLTARYRPASKPSEHNIGVVLLHGLGAGKDEWLPLEDALSKKGISTLAVDLRGHGGSLRKLGDKMQYQQFLDHGPHGEWMNMWRDAEAGYLFLEAKGHQRIGLTGASVGANVAAIAAASLPKVHFLVLLSPGNNYQGLEPAQAIQVYGLRPILLAASESDGFAFQSCQFFRTLRLAAHLPVDWIQAKSGHGVQMFQDSGVMDRVVSWMLKE